MGDGSKTRPTTRVDLRWEGGHKFTASDAYGHNITVDAPEKDGQQFDGFSPGELLLTSLAACSGIDVANILKKQRQKVTGVQIHVTGAQDPKAPWMWKEIHLEYVIYGKALKKPAVERSIHLSETKYCSIAASLGEGTKIISEYKLVDKPNE